MKYTCPRNPSHDRAYALHHESVCHVFSTSHDALTYIEDMRNTYEGEGYEGPLYCYECDRFDNVETILAPQAEEVLS